MGKQKEKAPAKTRSKKEEVIDDEKLADQNDEVVEGGSRISDEENSERIAPSEEPELAEEEKEADYLRQYQYKKVNNVPTIGGPLTDPDAGSKASRMKRHLLSQTRVRIMVPRAPGEHPSVLMTVCANGYRLDFPKNTYIEMPKDIAEVIMQSQRHTDAALQTSLIGSDEKKKDALL